MWFLSLEKQIICFGLLFMKRDRPLFLCSVSALFPLLPWGSIGAPGARWASFFYLSPPVPVPRPPPVRAVAPRSGRPTTAPGPPHNTRYILLPHSTHCAAQHPPRGGTTCSYPTTAKGTQHAQQRHEGEGRGFALRSPKQGLSAGTWRRKVVMCPRRGIDPASGHPRAHQPLLGRGTSPPAWDGPLDAPGQRRRQLPSSAWTVCREVKQGKSGGSVGTTDQGNGKGRSGERLMGTTAYRRKGQGKGKGSGEGRLG